MSTLAASARDAEAPVHVAILRKVRKGRQADFEARLAAFFEEAAHQPGVCGAYLIRPAPGSRTDEYGVLRTFRSEADMRRFYESETYTRWQDEVRPLVEGEPQKRQLHGLEAFFRENDPPPPQWKMALLTWIGVNPAVYLFSIAVPAVFGPLPPLAALLIVNVFVVASLTWGFMPVLTRLFRRWLQPRAS
jgi:antibiotic biosynthesis monooxygenase (ABM) superfamily enzyme